MSRVLIVLDIEGLEVDGLHDGNAGHVFVGGGEELW